MCMCYGGGGKLFEEVLGGDVRAGEGLRELRNHR